MFESGYYPPGAEYDPRAPWNQQEVPMVKCKACDGKGYHFYAYNFLTDQETECTEETWCCLPEKEQDAGTGHYIRGEKDPCCICHGEGEVEDEEDDEGPDNSDYYHERRLLQS